MTRTAHDIFLRELRSIEKLYVISLWAYVNRDIATNRKGVVRNADETLSISMPGFTPVGNFRNIGHIRRELTGGLPRELRSVLFVRIISALEVFLIDSIKYAFAKNHFLLASQKRIEVPHSRIIAAATLSELQWEIVSKETRRLHSAGFAEIVKFYNSQLKINLSDIGIKLTRLERMDKLGLPRPRSGNFAVVFPLVLGSNKWAVRCFTTYHHDQEMRYQKISQYLKQQALPYTVGFEFIKQGIKVKGSWYPILRMEWVEGESLLKYIERNLNKPAEIQSLAEQFYSLVSDLRKCGIAHGDLQHGNIIVVNSGCRLVDYDGMFVPGLEGLASNELGHPNYQHPLRGRNDFGPYLDNFSAWCIYISLLALAADPGLWHRISAGDEHICFRRKDIENPGSSPAMQALEKIKNDRVQRLFKLFKTIIYCPDICQIPSLDGAAIPKEPTKTGDEAITLGPDWLKDYIKKPPVKIPLPSLFERAFAKVLLSLVFFAFGFLIFSNFSDTRVAYPASFIVIGFPSLLIAMSVRFRKLPENARKGRLSSELRALQSDFRKAEDLLSGLEEDRRSVDQEKGKKIRDITLKQRDSTHRESNELAKVDWDLKDSINSITSKKNSLVHEEATELSAALRSIQTQYLLIKLSLHSLGTSSVIGIGPEMTRRLHANGIRTAADIADVQIVQRGYGRHTSEIAYIEVPGKGKVHVEGIGPKKGQALLAWKQQAEKKIAPYMPKSLASAQENAIRSKYFSKRQSLDAQEADAKKRAITTKDACKAKFRKEQEDLERQLSEARKAFANKLEGLDEQMADMRKYLSEKRWKIGMVELELKSYAPITFGSYFRRAFFG